MPVLNPSDRTSVVAVIAPSSQAAGALTSAWINAADFEHYLAIINLGVLGAGATVDAKLQQATDGAGTGAKDIPGRALTQITQAGGGSGKQAMINLRTEDMDINGNFRFIRVSMTVGVAASFTAATLMGFDAKYGPAGDRDAATVVEAVV